MTKLMGWVIKRYNIKDQRSITIVKTIYQEGIRK